MTSPPRERDGSTTVPSLDAAGHAALFDALADALLVADATGHILHANPAALALAGFGLDQLREMRLRDLLDGAADSSPWDAERLHEAASWRGEVDIRRADGSIVATEARIAQTASPGAAAFVASVRDLTARRRAEAVQRARMDRLLQLTDSLPVLVAFVDADTRYRFVNAAYEPWLGRPRALIIGRSMAEVLGEAGFAAVRPAVERALRGERVSYEAAIRMHDGRARQIAATYVPHIEDDGAVAGFYAMEADLTERTRTVEALRLRADVSALLVESLDAEELLRRLAELLVPRLADACVVDLLDDDGALRRLAVSSVDPPKAGWVWDVAREPLDPEAAHGPARVLRTGEPELAEEITDAFLERAARSAAHLAWLKRTRLLSHMIVPLRARGRTLGALTLVTTAHSARRYGPDDLVVAEDLAGRAALAVDNARLYGEAQAALQSRDEILSSVSHDLRTPITSIKGRAQVVLRRAQRAAPLDPEAVAEGMIAIDQVADRMTALVGELVDIGRLDSGRLLDLVREPADLAELVREASAEAQRMTNRHRIAVDAPPTLVGDWDGPRLERVLANLLSNSVRYSPDGGEIRVTLTREGGWARIVVRDRGVGIPPADLPRVFERFHRGANVAGRITGTGIGLAGAKAIVAQHGGTIQVESEEGRGATFTVRLPLPEEA